MKWVPPIVAWLCALIVPSFWLCLLFLLIAYVLYRNAMNQDYNEVVRSRKPMELKYDVFDPCGCGHQFVEHKRGHEDCLICGCTGWKPLKMKWIEVEDESSKA